VNTIKELTEMGAFVPDDLVKKTIKFKLTDEGEELEATVHVRQLSIGAHEDIFRADPDQRSTTAKLLSEAIRLGPDGKERMSYQQAYKLHPKMARAMAKAIAEANGTDRKN